MSEPNPVLIPTLQAAVPLWVMDLSRTPEPTRMGLAREAADTVASHGDVLIYGGKGCAAAFNALAKGIALLAYQPGGVTIFGHHWCVGSGHQGIPHDGGPCDAEAARVPRAGAVPVRTPRPFRTVELP